MSRVALHKCKKHQRDPREKELFLARRDIFISLKDEELNLLQKKWCHGPVISTDTPPTVQTSCLPLVPTSQFVNLQRASSQLSLSHRYTQLSEEEALCSRKFSSHSTDLCHLHERKVLTSYHKHKRYKSPFIRPLATRRWNNWKHFNLF